MAVALEEEIGRSVFEGNRDCGKCVHVNVCSVYRAVAGLINSFEVRKPFKAQELAKICVEFMPIYTSAPPNTFKPKRR